MKKLAMVLVFMAVNARAQEVAPCRYDGDNAYLSSIGVVAEPWEENTRLFADGAVRLVVIDTEEPAFAAVHLAVLMWGKAEIGLEARVCFLVSFGSAGFYDANLAGMQTSYSPAAGLVLTVPVSRYDPALDQAVVAPLELIINRQSNTVKARLQ